MNRENFEALLASSVFETLPKETQELLHRITLTEAMSVEVVTVEGATSEVVREVEGACWAWNPPKACSGA